MPFPLLLARRPGSRLRPRHRGGRPCGRQGSNQERAQGDRRVPDRRVSRRRHRPGGHGRLPRPCSRRSSSRIGGYRLVTESLPGGAALYRDTGTALSDENFSEGRSGRCHPVRGDGPARGALSGRHRDRAASGDAPGVRAVRRRAPGQGLSEHPGAACRSPSRRDRPDHPARVDRGAVRVARQGHGRGRPRGARYPGDHARHLRAAVRLRVRARPAAPGAAAARAG